MDAFAPLMFHTVQDTLLLLIASLLCLQWGSVSVHISSFAITVLLPTAHSCYIYSDLLLYRLTLQYQTDYCPSLKAVSFDIAHNFNLA